MIRPLLVVASRLKHAGDKVSYGSLARLLGVNHSDARELVDLLLGTGDDDVPRYLPLLEEGDGVSLSREPDYVCRELRLSHLETMALAAALDRVGIEAGKQPRTRIMARYGCPGDEDVVSGETARPDLPEDTQRLLRCALAIVSGRSLAFNYKGSKDLAPRPRRVRPKELRQNGEFWTLEALDLDADGERTFVIANMGMPTLLKSTLPCDGAGAPNAWRRTVNLRFADRHMLDLLEWPDLEVTGEDGGAVLARIPFYGGPWLVRRIASGGGSITTDDKELAALVEIYARSLL